MSFLNPLALALGLLGGAIVLMYLLKLKRKREEFSSTLLWVRSMEDLTANAPFQKLRQNLLMYLQILMLLLLALSLARPTMWLNRRTGASRIVLLDNTASMNAGDVAPNRSRLDAAKKIAGELIGNMKSGDQMMVVTFGGTARVVQPFTNEKATLNSTIRGIEPTDADARIQEALLIAQGVRKVEKTAMITIISDGGVGYLGNLITEQDPVEFLKVGMSDDNRGIVAFDIRQSFEKRGEAQAFAEVQNFSSQPADVTLRCLLDGKVEQVKEAHLDAKGKQGFAFAGLRGNRRLLRLELANKDMLASDDAVEGVLDLDATTRIELVSNGNFFLERVLSLVSGAKVTKIAPASYDPTAGADLVVFDQFAPKSIGPGRYLFINAVPPMEGFSRAENPVKDQIALDWNRLHPITRFINFEALISGEMPQIKYPDWVLPLVESSESPMVLAGDRQGFRLVCVAFDLYSTDWLLQPGFPVFISNTVQWLTAAGETNLSVVHRAGQTVTIQARGELADPVVVAGPEGEKWEIQPNESHLAFFNQTFRAGLYEVKQGKENLGRIAVNLLSPVESDITPKSEIISGEKKIAASALLRENREIWPWFALAGLVLLAAEWHLYCRRSWL